MADGILPIPAIPQPLRDAAQRGALIPFVGAGASVPSGCPTWGQLADGTLRACIEAGKFTYAQLAQIEHLSPRVGAMYDHALRVCRIAKQNEQSLENAWGTLRPVFEKEIAKCRNANFEISTLSASYVANLDFMSHAWLAANIRRLFPIEYAANLNAALGGLA